MLLLVLSLVLGRGASLPVDPSSNSTSVGWVPDPRGRGTTGLIISCFLTLGLCVWTSMHLNIPPKHETQVGYLLRSLKWAFLGILIPELVVLSAWRQWHSARTMGKELEKVFREQETKGVAPRRFKWTTEHSYFAGMGGFTFDAAYLPDGEDSLFVGPDRLTLTASGVLLLAQCGHLPDIDRETICDRSKADGTAKTLVCIQVFWMIGQVIGRMVARLPVTLLEVNTLGHVFCAFVIYALWWKKPKQVHTTVTLQGPWTGPLAAYMFMSSRISGEKLDGLVVLSQWILPELHDFTWHPAEDLSSDTRLIVGPMSEKSALKADIQKIPATSSIKSSQSPGALRRRATDSSSKLVESVLKPSVKKPTSIEDEHVRMNRHAACAKAIAQYSCIQARFERDSSRDGLKPILNHLVTDVPTNWPSDFYLPGISGELMGMALWLSSSLYGGIHLAAWMDYFPTTTERFLWRFSAAFIASSGAFWLLLCLIAFRWPLASAYWDRFIELRAWKIEYAVFGLCATVCGLAYIFARAFLVIGAVVSLRQLPPAAYQTPNWTAIFPHL